MCKYVIYTRVSTTRQGESGLGLEAQTKTCTDYITSGLGDLTMFQCFYIQVVNNKIRVSNSLSGSAFRYCKKEYLKTI